MADIYFNCSQCGKSLQIDAQGSGMQINCPGCGTPVTVPSTPLPASAPVSVRPTSVTVFGILNIVFGGLGLLCMPIGLIALFAMPNHMNSSALLHTWLIVSYSVGLIFTIWLLATGIGLLHLRRWARRGSLIYGWGAIVFGLIGAAVNVHTFVSSYAPGSVEAVSGLIGGLVGGLLGLAYPILLLIFMTRKPAVEACVR